MATFELAYAIANSWEVERVAIGEEVLRRMTWTTFREFFLEN